MRTHEIKIVAQMDRGLAYAEACFETFRVVQGQVFELVQHQRRLQDGLKSYGLLYANDELEHWFEQAISAASSQGDDILVRLTVSGGAAAWGLLRKDAHACHVQIQMMPYIVRHSADLETVIWPFPLREKRVKYTSDYAESLRAIQQWTLAKNIQNPMQALICSMDGHILSTVTANIALYRQGQWFTPQGAGILHGVVRHFLLQQGVLLESACPQSWLEDCEAMICLNSAVFVQAVASVDQRILDTRHPAMANVFNVLLGQPGVR
ncbi:MAG: aminotransferase class IV [Mariprofundaceae bacterium]|nr:aminotransferase class IV [Mariprofundaceae bacterium]